MKDRRKRRSGGSDSIRYGGVRLQTLNSIMIVLIVVVSVVLLIGLDILSDTYRSLRNTTDAYIACQDDARDMIEASDYLTNQARGFAVTGNRDYLDNYFAESKTTKRGAQAIADMEAYLPGSKALDYLEDALKASVDLMQREYYAMRLVVEAEGYRLSEFPEEIRAVELTQEDLELSSDAQMDKAADMVFGSEYQAEKDEIFADVQKCLERILTLVKRGEENDFQKMERTMHRVSILIGVMMFLFLAMIVLILRLIVRPLEDNVDHINEKTHLPMRGAFELQYMASVYNRMFDVNKENNDRLAYEAHHDALTGAYNRAGFEVRYQEEDKNSITLILLDVDRFKEVNDQHGHSEGDLVLQQVVHLIRSSFREEDYVCRIGGDEFAIILLFADASARDVIEEKFHQINEQLKNPVGTLPSVSISAGVAFPDRKNPTDNMFKDADAALYDMKRHGRSGIRFYGETPLGETVAAATKIDWDGSTGTKADE